MFTKTVDGTNERSDKNGTKSALETIGIAKFRQPRGTKNNPKLTTISLEGHHGSPARTNYGVCPNRSTAFVAKAHW